LLVLGLSAAALLSGLFSVSTGPYNLDEAIYILMVEAAHAGRVTIDNGYELYRSDALKNLFLIEGPHGLVPQYPSGYGFVALPFYLVAGVRGLILINVLAYLATMGVTYGLARELEASPPVSLAAAMIFGFANFGVTYAYGIWPQALALAIVAASALCILVSARAPRPGSAWVFALAGGLLLGFGVNIRVDAILLAPAVLLWLLAQRAQLAQAVSYAAGLVPGLILAAWLNCVKFGSWLPFNYGTVSGNSSLCAYWPLFPVIAIGMILALALSRPPLRLLRTRRNVLIAVGACILVALLLDKPRAVLLRILSGYYALCVDFQAYRPPADELSAFSFSAGGHMLLYGQLKRALLQSLPFLGVLALLGSVDHLRRKSAHVLFVLIAVLWTLPFAFYHWHGGSPQNMRYLLPILPFLSAMTAVALAQLRLQAGLVGGPGRLVLYSAALSLIATAWVFVGVLMGDGLALSIAAWGSLVLAGATAATTLLVVVATPDRRGAPAHAALALGVAGLVWAGASGLVHDLLISQCVRTANLEMNLCAAQLDEGVLILAPQPQAYMPQLTRENSFVAVPGDQPGRDLRGLIDYHIVNGRRVYVDGKIAATVLAGLGNPAYHTVDVTFGQQHLVEIRPAEPSKMTSDWL
jgi:hypothetical protein